MVILTNFKKEDFDIILSKYSIGKYKSSKHVNWALSNTVYFLNTTKGKYVLKIYEGADRKFIDYQISTQNFLSKKNIPVANIQKQKNGSKLLIYKKKKILIQDFIQGDSPKQLSTRLLKDLGRKFGIMNKELSKFKLTGKYTWKKIINFI